MSGTTSVPQPIFNDKGFQVPADQLVLQGVFADMNAAFGGNLNLALESPQGQIASTFTAIIQDKNDQFVLLTQNVDPAYSSGRMQDAIGRIYFLPRYQARATVVECACIGLQGVVIPAGTLAKATDGNTYSCTLGGTIPATGSITLSFTCQVKGPISCPTGTLNQIYTAIPGWDAIINNQDGEVGADVEGRTAYEIRRFASVAGNSAGMLASVQGAVLNVPGVLDAYTTENFGNTNIYQDGVTLPPHSLYVCVSGGDPNDVAKAIFTRKPPGCAMAGDTTIPVQDSNTLYNTPYPTYAITFQTAKALTFAVTVTLLNSTQVPSTAQSDIATAIVNTWNGQGLIQRARIGSIIFASQYYAAVAALGSWAQIISIKLGTDGAPAATFQGAVSGSQLTVTFVSTGTLASGQTIRLTSSTANPSIADGTQIVSQASGTPGGVGVYNLNVSITSGIAQQNMLSIMPSMDDVQVGIAHYPALSTANVTVVLAATP